MRQLNQLIEQFLRDRNLHLMVGRLFEATSDIAAVKAITLRLRNEITGNFEPFACHNLDFDEWRMAVPRAGVGLSERVIDSQRAVIVVNIQNRVTIQNAQFLQKHGLVSYAGIPLLASSEVIGVMGFYSGDARGFVADELEYLTLLADLTALAVVYARRLQSEAAISRDTEIMRAPSAIADRSKAEFLNVMSHEFRTPLSLIMGHAGLMREGLLGEVNEEQRNSLDRVLENSDNLLAMVLSILQASRIEAGGIQLVAQRIVLHALFDELKAAYGAQENDQRKIVWYCPPDLPEASADRDRLKDILRHLVDNAVKSTPRGRIVVSAESSMEPRGIRISVADTGVGVSPDALSFIFESFRQSDSSGTRAFEGTGLGLYIAKKYAEMLGGELSVISELGKGSTFTLMLPLGV